MNRRNFNTLVLAVFTSGAASSVMGQKYKLINARSLKTGKYKHKNGDKNVLEISKLQLVKLDLKGLSGDALLMKSGTNKLSFDQWRREAKIPANAKTIMIAHRATDFPGVTRAQVSKLESLSSNETMSWTSGDTMVGTYGCTDYGYWCTRT